MSILLNEETKTVTEKTYDRCRSINIKSVLNADHTYTETISQQYERVMEIDGVIVKKEDAFGTTYDANTLLNIKWTTPWGKEVTGLDVMAFIKKFNDNYEVALTTNQMPNG